MQEMNTFWKLSLAVGCAAGAAWLKWCSGVQDDSKTSGVRSGLDSNVTGDFIRVREANSGANRAPMTRADETQHGTVIDMEAYFTSISIANWARRHDLHRSPDVGGR